MSGTAVTPSELRECPGCGLFQVVPGLAPGMAAQCSRCHTVIRRARTEPLRRGLALNLAGLMLLAIMATTSLMTVSKAGIEHAAGLFSGPAEIVARGMPELAAVVVFVSLVAPFGKLAGNTYVLFRLLRPNPPRHLARVFKAAQWLSPWSMIDVFVFGVLVAYVKLSDLVTITLDAGVFALFALTIVLAWADAVLDRNAVWEALEAERPIERAVTHMRLGPHAAGCETCGLVAEHAGHGARCRRCDAPLHERKPDSIARTWALTLGAAILYVPANYYPVLTVVQLGAGQPSTILGGVEELLHAQQYPLAALVFFASIAVPMLKLFGLAFMLTTTQLRSAGVLRGRTRLFEVVRFIGRWSMIDIFMESLLGALVRFGALVTIQPGIGAVAFCGVVILTMIAVECFDPRLMWDAAEEGQPAEAYVRRATG